MRSGLFPELYCLDCKFVLWSNLAWMETDLAHSCKMHPVPRVKETWEKKQLQKYWNALLCFYLSFSLSTNSRQQFKGGSLCINRCRIPYYHILYCIKISLHRPTWKACRSFNQSINSPRFLRPSYRAYKNPPLDPILSQMNRAHALQC